MISEKVQFLLLMYDNRWRKGGEQEALFLMGGGGEI